MSVVHAKKRSSPRVYRVLILMAAALALLILLEISLRLWSFWNGGPVAVLAGRTPAGSFTFASDDPWEFDPKHGFVGRPGLRYIIGYTDGKNVWCNDNPNSLWPARDLGPDWASADMRISFFGADDALSQPEWDQRSWPSALAEELSRRSGRRVAVANYSRPGVGPLQALVLAAEIAPANRSNLVVLAPTTGSLAMDFVYRAAARLETAMIPVASGSPNVRDDPTLGTPIGPIVNRSITELWCEQTQMTARAGLTRVLRYNGLLSELQGQANVASLLTAQPVSSDWASTQSALVRFLSGESPAFNGVKRTFRVAPHYLGQPALDRDSRAAEAAAALNSAGIPVVVVLSPIWPELLQRRLLLQYSGAEQGFLDSLLASIERLTGHPLLRMVDAVDRNLSEEGAKLVGDPQRDWSLRPAGVEFYATLSAQLLMPIVASALDKSATRAIR